MEPVSRRELIKRLHKLGFRGPVSASKHSYMQRDRDKLKLRIPNPHSAGADIGSPILDRILKQAGISKEEWESTKD